MKNIHLLPTEEPSRLFLDRRGTELNLNRQADFYSTGRVVYITSDEYIGLSYYLDGDLVRKGVVDDKAYWEVRKDYKKIILTTNQDLIKEGVQDIPDEFLEWFVKNPSCKNVEITRTNKCKIPGCDLECVLFKTCENIYNGYEIIIPKESFEHEVKVIPVEEIMTDRCSAYKFIDFDKQETLEEAAEQIQQNLKTTESKPYEYIFKLGAQWQSERSFSEEDMIEFGEWMKCLPLTISGYVVNTKTKSIVVEKTKELLQIWFNQFKNKS